MSQTLGFEDMVFDSYDQWSHQSELGVAFSSMKLIENGRLQMAFQPEFRVHWVHEFEPIRMRRVISLQGVLRLCMLSCSRERKFDSYW